jgi:class 3 adenylate cyclase/tetratricopeptide (TPR) repeat protein
MKCPQCGFENPKNTKFCGECGAKLEVTCPMCRFANLPTSKFCCECGHKLPLAAEKAAMHPSLDDKIAIIQRYLPERLTEKILSQRGRVEGEHKQVTVMFCDMQGFTPLSERLGPEDAYSTMNQVYEILIQKVHEFEGTVNEMTGDGIMALFGAPIAVEDAPQRAIRSAQAIHMDMTRFSHKIRQERAGIPPLKMRIGIHSGPVVVGTLGNDLRVEFKAVGDTVNLASRMETLAEPGTTYVTEATFKLTEGLFLFEALGEKEVKGKSEKVRVFRVIAPSTRTTRFDVSAERGLTPFVGRSRELELMLDAFERSKEGRGQAISIVAEAGVGKSRLLYEFRKAIANEDVTFLEGRCLSYGRNVAYHPVIDLLKSNFNIHEEHSDEEIRAKVLKGLRITGVDTDSTLPYILELLSVPGTGIDPRLSPEARKERIIEALNRLVLGGAAVRPVVIAIEDLHWIDKNSEQRFKSLLDGISGSKVFLIFTYRPEFVHTWGAKSYHSQLNLNRLSNRESLAMVTYLLGTENVESGLEEFILEKTEGIPFFIEEFVRSLTDLKVIESRDHVCRIAKDIQTLTIPATIRDVIMVRIDSLPDAAKELLQTGSVIEREFSYELIKLVTGLGEKDLLPQLSILRDAELIYERGIYPQSTYVFKHALTQEVAYGSLLQQKRREIHGRVARALEELYAGRAEHHCELLANHWELSNTPDRSVAYLIAAGEKANSNQAATAAVAFFTRALNQIEKSGQSSDPRVHMRIRSGRAVPLHSQGKIEESLQDYEEALRLARAAGDQQMQLRCLTGIPVLIYNTVYRDKVPDYCEQGLEVARRLGDLGAESLIMAAYVYFKALWNESDESAAMRRALALAEKSGQPLAQIRARWGLALLERWFGNPRAALDYLENFLKQTRHILSIFDVTLSSFIHGMALTDAGRYHEAMVYLGQWIGVLERNEVFLNLGRCYNCMGWVHSELYDFDHACKLNTKALENAIYLRKSPGILFSALEMQAQTEVNLMENEFEMGRIDEAWDHILRFEAQSAAANYDYIRVRWQTRMKDLKGSILLCRGDLDGAEEIARQNFEKSTARGYKKNFAKAERLWGQILSQRSAYDVAEAKLKAALSKLREIGNPKQIWMTQMALARMYAKMKRPDLEREQWQAAAAGIHATAAGLRDPKMQTLFVQAAPVREILQHANS